jgi:hypothetical protein
MSVLKGFECDPRDVHATLPRSDAANWFTNWHMIPLGASGRLGTKARDERPFAEWLASKRAVT